MSGSGLSMVSRSSGMSYLQAWSGLSTVSALVNKHLELESVFQSVLKIFEVMTAT